MSIMNIMYSQTYIHAGNFIYDEINTPKYELL